MDIRCFPVLPFESNNNIICNPFDHCLFHCEARLVSLSLIVNARLALYVNLAYLGKVAKR